jgi:ribosomal protein S24E
MKVIKDFRNELLKRREIKIITEAEKNPGFAGALKMITEHFKVKEDVVVAREVKSKFGRDTFLIDAFIYDSSADKERVERKKKDKKSKEAGAAAPAQGGKK